MNSQQQLLEPSTIQDIVNEGRTNVTTSYATLPQFYVE